MSTAHHRRPTGQALREIFSHRVPLGQGWHADVLLPRRPAHRPARYDRRGYDPDEPRVPRGSPEGGRWTKGGALPGPAEAIARGLELTLQRAAYLSADQRRDYAAAARTVLARMTPEAHERFRRHLRSVSWHRSVDELGAYLASRVPALKAMIDRGRRIGGAYHPAAGMLVLDGPHDFPTAEALGGKGTAIEHVYAHEFGHVVDGPARDLSRSADWLAAYAQEIATPEAPLSRYATSHPAEGLAEFARLVFTRHAPLATVEREFPMCSAFWKAHGLWPEQPWRAERHARAPEWAPLPELFAESFRTEDLWADVLAGNRGIVS